MNLELNSEIIEDVNTIKILGVFFDSDTKWKSHVDLTVCRAFRSLSMVKRLFTNGASTAVLLEAYNAFVLPIIYYCWPVYCDAGTEMIRVTRRLDKIIKNW